MCTIKTFLGNCCGVGELKNLSQKYKLSSFETPDERSMRVLKSICTFIDKDGTLAGGSGSKNQEKLQAYVFADRLNSNGQEIADYIKTLDVGEVYESKEMINSYSTHGGLKGTGKIKLFVFYPNWEKLLVWFEQYKDIIQEVQE